MKIKKPLIKLITIGSLFFMFSLSFTGVVSLNDEKVNSFWAVKKLNISFVDSTYAESGGGESGGYQRNERRENERNERESGGYRPTPTTPNNPTPTNPTTPNNPTSPSTPTTPGQTCKTVYDTVTTASGGTIQEPREVCTTNPTPTTPKVQGVPEVKKTPTPATPKVQGAPEVKKTTNINNNVSALSDAEKAEIKTQFDAIYTKIVNISSTQSEIDTILNKISDIISSTIGKINTKIASLTNVDLKNKYKKQLSILQELDALVFDKTMGTSSIVNSILNDSISFTPIKHVAPIGTTYTIIQTSNGKYSFKRENGTYTDKTWNTPEAVIAYIDKNAVPAAVNKTPVARPTPVVINRPKPAPAVKPAPKPTPAPKPAPAPVATPAPAPAPVPTTTTTAS